MTGWTTCPACCGETSDNGGTRPCERCEDTGVIEVPEQRETDSPQIVAGVNGRKM